MDPSALQERKWTFGKVQARQSVGVMGEGARSYLYVCTTFSVPMGELGFAHHAKGSSLEFSEADVLSDETRRERLALEHMAKLNDELRLAANMFSVALTERAEADAQAKKEARASLEAEVGALSW